MTSMRHGIRRLSAAALLLGVVGLGGCDINELLEVTDRDTVNPGTLDDPANLQIVVNGAMGDFTTAFASNDDYLIVSALISDEFISSGTFSTRTATDRRDQFQPDDGNTSDEPYVNLHQARRSLHDAAEKVAEFEDTSDPRYAELKALEAYAYLMLGEGWCPAVPVSTVDENGDFVEGTPQTGVQLFTTAVAIFDSVLAVAPTSNLAMIGKARAQVNLGNFSAAATTVASVPMDYNYFIYHSVSGIGNPVFNLQSNGRYSVADNEGGNGLPFITADDPRVPVVLDGVGFDPSIPLYIAEKYTDNTDPTPLASGMEAFLIRAEAAMQSGDQAGRDAMVGLLNQLRQNVATLMDAQIVDYDTKVAPADQTLPDLASPTTQAAAIDMLFYERGFWLYLTGHRLADLRRQMTQYSMTEDNTYPTGAYHKGGTYGDDVVFPLDFDETNNTVFVEAGGLDLCVETSAAFQ